MKKVLKSKWFWGVVVFFFIMATIMYFVFLKNHSIYSPTSPSPDTTSPATVTGQQIVKNRFLSFVKENPNFFWPLLLASIAAFTAIISLSQDPYKSFQFRGKMVYLSKSRGEIKKVDLYRSIAIVCLLIAFCWVSFSKETVTLPGKLETVTVFQPDPATVKELQRATIKNKTLKDSIGLMKSALEQQSSQMKNTSVYCDSAGFVERALPALKAAWAAEQTPSPDATAATTPKEKTDQPKPPKKVTSPCSDGKKKVVTQKRRPTIKNFVDAVQYED